ncbi:PaaI family thioesterase [Thermodesulfobacteriota bacterium]
MNIGIQNSTLFKKLFANYIVPMNRTLGIKLKTMEDNETVMIMKGKRKITNYGGTIHGGAIMALAETVHGGAVLNKVGAFENLMVTKKCNLKFLKKARGNLKVCFKLSAESETYIKSHLEKNGKCEIELVSAVTDSQGDTVAELTALYYIKRLRKKPRKAINELRKAN